MHIVRIIGLAFSLGLCAVAVILATTPWRVHGGRFVTEYLLLGGGVALVGVVALIVTLKWT